MYKVRVSDVTITGDISYLYGVESSIYVECALTDEAGVTHTVCGHGYTVALAFEDMYIKIGQYLKEG